MSAKFVYLPKKEMWVNIDTVVELSKKDNDTWFLTNVKYVSEIHSEDAKILQKALADHAWIERG